MKSLLMSMALFSASFNISCSMNKKDSKIYYEQFNPQINEFFKDFKNWSSNDQNKIVCRMEKDEICFKKIGSLSNANKYRDSVFSFIFKNIDPQNAKEFAEILTRLKNKNK